MSFEVGMRVISRWEGNPEISPLGSEHNTDDVREFITDEFRLNKQHRGALHGLKGKIIEIIDTSPGHLPSLLVEFKDGTKLMFPGANIDQCSPLEQLAEAIND